MWPKSRIHSLALGILVDGRSGDTVRLATLQLALARDCRTRIDSAPAQCREIASLPVENENSFRRVRLPGRNDRNMEASLESQSLCHAFQHPSNGANASSGGLRGPESPRRLPPRAGLDQAPSVWNRGRPGSVRVSANNLAPRQLSAPGGLRHNTAQWCGARRIETGSQKFLIRRAA